LAVDPGRGAVIVGGGIAGLAAAHRLQRLAPSTPLTLFESERRLGGKILTESSAGFVVEAGPDSFLSYKPGALELCRELGLEERLRGPDETLRRTFVARGGRLHELPEGLTGLVPSRLGPLARSTLLSLRGKLRLGLEALVPPRRSGGDESLASFLSRRLGREAYEYLVEPLMAGIYAGDGGQLSLQATFPQLREMELRHGSLLRALRAARRAGSSMAVAATGGSAGAPPTHAPTTGVAAGRTSPPRRLPAFLTLEGGLGEMVEALQRRLERVRLRLGERVARLSRAGDGYLIETDRGAAGGEPARVAAVVLAVPAPAAADVVAGLDPELARLLRGIPHVSTATVSLAFPASSLPRPLAGHGYIVPRAEGRPVLACTWSSSKFPHRAPAGSALVRVFVGRAGDDAAAEQEDARLVDLARRELRQALEIDAPPTLARVYRWPRGMPQYTLGHPQRLDEIDRRLQALPGLFLAGNAYRGVGLPDCIRSGETAAASAAAWLEAAGGLRREAIR
jgi:oxygen-dependent protoporphyrinogen oxidase